MFSPVGQLLVLPNVVDMAVHGFSTVVVYYPGCGCVLHSLGVGAVVAGDGTCRSWL